MALDRGVVRDVAFDGREAAAEFGDARGGLLHRREIAVDAIDRRAFLREQHGGGATIAPAGTDANPLR